MPNLVRRALCLALILCCSLLPLAVAVAAQALDPMFRVGGAFPFAPDTPILEIFYLGTRRSDGIFLRCNGSTLLVDGGARRDFPLLEQFLLAETGSLHVGALLNTHEDNDHLDAQIEFLKKGGASGAFLSPSPPNPKTRGYDKLLPLLEKAGVPYARVSHGELWQLGGGEPGDGAYPVQSLSHWQGRGALLRAYCSRLDVWDINRSSLVLHVTFGKRTALLMADATGETQWDFLALGDVELRADVLKAAHHGISATVTPFLDAVDPKLGIITNTRQDAQAQTRQFNRREIPAYYTDEGTVYMATDGEIWYIRQEGSS